MNYFCGVKSQKITNTIYFRLQKLRYCNMFFFVYNEKRKIKKGYSTMIKIMFKPKSYMCINIPIL